MINLSGIFHVTKDQYIQFCVLGSFFCYKSQKCLFKEALITVITMNKHDMKFSHWGCIKNNHSTSSWLSRKRQGPSYVFAGLFACSNWQKSTQKPEYLSIICSVTRYKVSHCEYIKNDPPPMCFCCLGEYIWTNVCFGG